MLSRRVGDATIDLVLTVCHMSTMHVTATMTSHCCLRMYRVAQKNGATLLYSF